MKKIEIDLGLEEYQLGNAIIKINPADVYFLDKMSNAFERLEGLQNKLRGQIAATNDYAQKYKYFETAKKDMLKVFDDLFDKKGIGNEILEGVAPFIMGKNTIPVWANALVPLAAESAMTFKAANDEDNPELRKYIDKYGAVFDI